MRMLSLIQALRYGIFFILSGVSGLSLLGIIFRSSARSFSCLSGFLARQYRIPVDPEEVCGKWGNINGTVHLVGAELPYRINTSEQTVH